MITPPLLPYITKSVGGGAPPAWTPTSISGCVFWLPPVAGTGGYMYTDHLGASEVTADGQVVGMWADASGVGNNATQSTAGNKGLYKTNIQNSLPMVLFDGTNDYLVANGVASSFTGTDAATTVAVVFKKVGNTGQDVLYSSGDSVTANPFTRLFTNGVSSYQYDQRDDAATYVLASGGTPNTVAHIVLARYNGTTIDVWVDTTQIASAASFDVGTKTLTNFTIGIQDIAGVSNPFEGYIGEVIVWNNAISNADALAARTALISKWGL